MYAARDAAAADAWRRQESTQAQGAQSFEARAAAAAPGRGPTVTRCPACISAKTNHSRKSMVHRVESATLLLSCAASVTAGRLRTFVGGRIRKWRLLLKSQ